MKIKFLFEKMELDGDIIAVPVGERASELNAVLNVNEEAMRILELLQQETNEQEIVSQLLQEYDCSKDDITPVVHDFIEQLRQEGMLEE